MKLIIDIPDMIYNILNGDSSWGGLSVDYILHAVKDGTPLEAQSTNMRDATEEERKSVKDYVDSVSKPTGVNFNKLLRDCGTCKHNTGIDCGQYPCNECNRRTHPLYEPKIAQPTDVVSREAVLELAKKGILVSNDNYKCVVNAIKSLPSVTPQKPKGNWIYIGNIEVTGLKICECSVCGKRTYGSSKYCPNCNAEMED